MAQFGDTSEYTSNSTCHTTANGGRGTTYNPASGGIGDSITAYMYVIGSRGSHSGKKFKYALYHWSGSQWDLVDTTAEHSVSLLETYPMWRTLAFVGSPTIISGDAYMLAALGEAVTSGTMAIRISSGDVGDDVSFDATTYATGFGDPFSVDASLARNPSIYCDYTGSSESIPLRTLIGVGT